MKLHDSIGHGASKNKSMGMRDAHSIPLIVFSVMKKFVDQVCPHFPVLGDVNPSGLILKFNLIQIRVRYIRLVPGSLPPVRVRYDLFSLLIY